MPPTVLKRKITIRDSARTSIDKLVKEFDELKVSDNPQNERIIALRDTFIEKLSKVTVLNDEIIEIIEDEKVTKEDEEATNFSVYAKEKLSVINKFITEKDETVTVSSSVARASVRLPKLNLRNFDGKPENWSEFWDTFNNAVHENDSISNTQKMTYLKTLVSGTAAQSIAGFKTTSENYTAALQLLRERYENKHLQISLHMNNLLETPPIKEITRVEELRTLYNTIETQMRSLANLDIDDSMYGPFLIPVLQRKIPNELNLIFSRNFHSKDSWDIKELLEQFKIELMAREKSVIQSEEETCPPFTAASLVSGNGARAQNPEYERKLSCIFCGKSHRSQHCKLVTDSKSRKSILMEKGRCFRCLQSGHLSRNCSSKIKCFNCGRSHHQAVCEGEQPNKTTEKATHTMHTSSYSPASVLLQTAQADLISRNNNILRARILFDTGSQLSYISKELRHRLNLKTIERKEIFIKAFGSISSKETLEKVTVKIKTLDGNIREIDCFVKDICHPLTAQNTTLTADNYPHLRKLRLADPNQGNCNIDILIGSDNYWSFMTNEIVRGASPQSPIAIRSTLGFILSGPTSVKDSSSSSTVLTSHILKCEAEFIEPNEVLTSHLDRFWTLETLDPDQDADTEPDICKDFRENLNFDWEQGKYRVSLPFKDNHDLLPDNYSNCVKRLKSLQKRFSKDNDLLQNYHKIVKDQLDSGVIEPVPDSEVKPVGQVHYLPHRPVIRYDRSTTKIRMVFDASSKSNGTSLNGCLHPGPSLTESLFGVLLRFRLFKFVFTADIEKAFLRILLAEENKDFVRFLWYQDCPDLNNNNIESIPVQIYRLCCVLFGVNSSPFLLSATLIEHFEQLPDKDFVRKVLKSFHVDDLISGGDTEPETLQLYQDTKEHLSIASFNLRKFLSNSDNLNVTVHGTEHSFDPMSKVLGLFWDRCDDCIQFHFDYLYRIAFEIPSKRELLSFMASIYDPLGLLNPFIVRLKILFQKICISKITWDCKIDDILLKDWKAIRDDFLHCDVIRFDRWVHTLKVVERVEIHGFSDASLQAYGACVYLKVQSHGEVFVSLLTAKSRIAPSKSTTIPKLELMGALLLAKLVRRVSEELSPFCNIDDCFCWVDSMVSLHWICDVSKSYQAFVQRRVDQIRSIVPPDHWFHVDTKSNPADILSRGVSLSQLVKENLWRHGPKFISSLECYNEFSLSNKLVTNSTTVAVATQEVLVPVIPDSSINVFEVVDISRFNNIDKLIRVVAYVQRFIKNLKKNHPRLSSNLSVNELLVSTDLLVSSCQRDIITSANFNQLQQNLRLYADEKGLLRCRGRIENATLPFDTKFPLFIPKCKFAVLLIRAAHENVKHNGLKETINELRTRYWIPKARTFVKSVIRECHLCKRMESKPYCYPPSPALPSSRVTVQPPFTHSAIDYAGPLRQGNLLNEH